jgi:hypothetical protein
MRSQEVILIDVITFCDELSGESAGNLFYGFYYFS